MPSQKVYRLPKRTSFHDLSLEEEPIPQPSKYEVLIKVRSVSLNYRDLAITDNTYPFAIKDNVVPCSDVAGEIVEAAPETGFQKGDKVIGTFDITTQYGTQQDWNHGLGGPIDGVLREYLTLPAHVVIKLPESSLTFDEWACVPCTGATAYNALFGNVPLRPGQTVLLQGTGGVSITGLMLARAAGATTIITSSSDDKLKTVKEKFGAHHGINYKNTPDWAEEVRKITNGKGADHILENGGSGTIAQSIAACARGGIISIIGFLQPAKQADMPDVATLALGGTVVLRGIAVGSTQLTEELVQFIGERDLKMPVNKTFGFSRDEVLSAYQYMKDQQAIGKICIKVA